MNTTSRTATLLLLPFSALALVGPGASGADDTLDPARIPTLGSAPAGPATPVPAHVILNPDSAAARVDRYLSRLEAFGLAGNVLLARGGDVLLARGYGLADRGGSASAGAARNEGTREAAAPSRPWTAATVSTVGSITKQFTAAAVMKLVDRGRISVDDSIGRFFDDVPPDKRGITLHHLLTHTAGLGEVGPGDFDFLGREEIVRRAMATDLLSVPGTDYRYSNLGYSLLGAVVESVTGRGYERWLRENLLVPAGMYETGYLLPEYEADRVAVGYRNGDRWGTVTGRLSRSTGPSWVLRANGGVHSTLYDMLRWIRALGVLRLDGAAEAAGRATTGRPEPILSARSRERMFAPHADAGGGAWYGYGWGVDTTSRGTPTYRHDGGNGILHADLHLFPEEGLVTFMMTSDAGLRATQLLNQVDRVYFGESVPMPPAVDAVEADPDALESLAGRYRGDEGSALVVESAGTALVIHVEGQRALDRVWTGDRPGTVPYDTLNRRAATFVDAFVAGDFETMRSFMGPDAPEDPYAGFRARILARIGPVRGVEVLGTVPAWFHGGSSEATWVRLELERSTMVRRIHWSADGRVVGLGGQVYPAPITLRCAMTGPASCTGWHAGLDLGDPRVMFGQPGEEGARSIVIEAAEVEIRGRKGSR